MESYNIKDALNDDENFMNPYTGDEVGFDPFVIKEAKLKPPKKKTAKAQTDCQMSIEDLITDP